MRVKVKPRSLLLYFSESKKILVGRYDLFIRYNNNEVPVIVLRRGEHEFEITKNQFEEIRRKDEWTDDNLKLLVFYEGESLMIGGGLKIVVDSDDQGRSVTLFKMETENDVIYAKDQIPLSFYEWSEFIQKREDLMEIDSSFRNIVQCYDDDEFGNGDHQNQIGAISCMFCNYLRENEAWIISLLNKIFHSEY